MNKFLCNFVLRVLMLELADKDTPDVFENNLAIMLIRCCQLEVSYCI